MPDFQYRPICSGVKSRHLTYREPENPVRSAYMKRLQEHDDTRRIYDINPYFQVFRLKDMAAQAIGLILELRKQADFAPIHWQVDCKILLRDSFRMPSITPPETEKA